MKRILLVFLMILLTATGYCENETFVIEEINLEMVKCPAGKFMMGSPEEEQGRFGNENQHLVTITKPFYIGRYEVTQSQYEHLMERNPSEFKGANKPVDSVSYNDAKAFCDKLNQKYLSLLPKGYRFDLPTEALWEYACRAGTKTALNNGNNLTSTNGDYSNIDEVAWYANILDSGSHLVGQKKPNAWGIYDMHGNVSEWCRDWYGEYPNEEAIDPMGDNNTSARRVYRGGSYGSSPTFCRSAIRIGANPDIPTLILGFRVALVCIE